MPRCAPRSRCTPSAARCSASTPAAFDAPSTKQAAGLLADARGGATLVVLTGGRGGRRQVVPQPRGRRSCCDAENAGVADILRPGTLVASQAAVDALTARAAKTRGGEGGGGVMEPSQVIIRPVVSEKSYVLATADKYTFRVHKDAHKTQIKQAVEALFDVTVLEVRTSAVPSKPKRRGYTSGRTREWKKAVVQVREGDSIPIFQGLEADL